MKLKPEDDQRLADLFKELTNKSSTFIGYPTNAVLSYSNLGKFLDFTINNVGDPFSDCNYKVSTREFEKEVLHFFGDLMHIEPDDFWGYVTNGGTEGNMYGLYLGRETYPDGIIYYSEDTHYSISKTVRVLNSKHVMIKSQPNGEMDYNHFKETVSSLSHYPVIVNANIGTTMKGAIDNVANIVGILNSLNIKDYYIHCDAALFGIMLPFINHAPIFDFRLPISSISISGHKFLGSPIPSGIALARRDTVKKIERSIEYIGSLDSTLSGSRDGFSVLILWQAIKHLELKGIEKMVHRCMNITTYALSKFAEIGYPAWVNPYSNIIIIKRPSEEIIQKWQLAPQGDDAHIIIMPHTTTEMVDEFVGELE